MCSLRNENELHFSVDLYKWWFPWNSAFTQYLHHLNNHFSHRGDRLLHLILDLYSVHRDAEIKAHANELNIQLHFIPAGMTDKLQPLDRNCFGALKATARRLFRERYKDDPFAVSRISAVISHGPRNIWTSTPSKMHGKFISNKYSIVLYISFYKSASKISVLDNL